MKRILIGTQNPDSQKDSKSKEYFFWAWSIKKGRSSMYRHWPLMINSTNLLTTTLNKWSRGIISTQSIWLDLDHNNVPLKQESRSQSVNYSDMMPIWHFLPTTFLSCPLNYKLLWARNGRQLDWDCLRTQMVILLHRWSWEEGIMLLYHWQSLKSCITESSWPA